MQQYLIYFMFIAGFVLIIKGGDFLVDSAIKIAKATGISEVVIGTTIVSLATTLPEILVSVIATARGSIEFAVANATGSMLSNIGLTLALLLSIKVVRIQGRALPVKAVYLVASALLAYVCIALDRKLDAWEGCVLLGGFILFMVINLVEAKRAAKNNNNSNGLCKEQAQGKKGMVLLFLLGAVGVGAGAWLLVEYGTKVAGILGVPDRLVAVTMVAIGTGLPELVTGITAIKKNKVHLCVGNIIGANIINGSLLLGLVSIIGNGIPLQGSIFLELPLIMLLSLILVVPLLYKKRSYRWQGFAMMAIYIAFIAYNVIAFR